jgi:CRP-like cAMP-binding protein
MAFGELALMYDAPRAATVVATSVVHAWALDRLTFKQVMFGTTQRRVRSRVEPLPFGKILYAPALGGSMHA